MSARFYSEPLSAHRNCHIWPFRWLEGRVIPFSEKFKDLVFSGNCKAGG